jgi:hypothetical protein
MADVKKLNDYKVNQTDPYDGNNKYVSEDNNLSIIGDQDDDVTKNIVEVHYIRPKEVIEKIVCILKDKLKISRSGLVLFRYIHSTVSINHKKGELNLIEIDHKVCAADMGYTSYQSVYNSILELLDKNIIARSGSEKVYFLNPMFFSKTKNLLITEYYKMSNEIKDGTI